MRKILIPLLFVLLFAHESFAEGTAYAPGTQPGYYQGAHVGDTYDLFGDHLTDAMSIPPTTFYTDTTTALTASSTFTGTARALPTNTSARYFYVSVYSDQGSALNGFQILGFNGTGYVPVAEGTTAAGTPDILYAPLIYSSYEVKMINGTTNQTTLWIQSGFAN